MQFWYLRDGFTFEPKFSSTKDENIFYDAQRKRALRNY